MNKFDAEFCVTKRGGGQPTPQKQGITLNNAAAAASMFEWGGSKIWFKKKKKQQKSPNVDFLY